MWYVIQSKTGDENKIKLLLEELLDKSCYKRCFVPLYESVRHRQEKSLIMMKKLLPGYLFVETDYPEKVHHVLRSLPDYADVLGARENREKEKCFVPVGKEDESFFDSILEDGIMHVSYVHLSKANRIDKVVGPLKQYRNYITKMEFRHRYATVETEIFGKRRKLQFGLWSDQDPKMPWLEEQKEKENINTVNGNIINSHTFNIGINPGDKVEYPEIYGDTVFVVDRVDPAKRILHTTIDLFGSARSIEMYVDDVKKIG
ncbi:Transcription antitermination factor NusG [Butyrivibrio proteoclasticus]|uniref:Transcription antitermination factor NusG n=1 Tax=Butyrivibrio proteoclasticus TaxID=43305 RepID=A0A1I5VUY9_9FIRM|nr:transcription termination/antitermination NusG family protein [Butyrivibrio proteoclasticus]SFQ11302.1 Transcription antitermination factor NusG [Butyrivibrio proteoclasticus]